MTVSPDVLALAQERFGIEEWHDEGPMIDREQLVAFSTALRDELDFAFFVYVVSVHYPEVAPIEANEEKGTEAEPGKPDCTLVHYCVRRMANADRGTDTVSFRCFVPTGETCPTVCGVWAGADWQEREQFDLVGTVFADHPDLRRIMMPEDWPGHPLRRDYAIETKHFPWR